MHLNECHQCSKIRNIFPKYLHRFELDFQKHSLPPKFEKEHLKLPVQKLNHDSQGISKGPFPHSNICRSIYISVFLLSDQQENKFNTDVMKA